MRERGRGKREGKKDGEKERGTDGGGRLYKFFKPHQSCNAL